MKKRWNRIEITNTGITIDGIPLRGVLSYSIVRKGGSRHAQITITMQTRKLRGTFGDVAEAPAPSICELKTQTGA